MTSRLTSTNESQPRVRTSHSRLLALQKRAAGFTLIEVCVAMAIGVLILGIAVISMAGMQAETQLKRMASRVETLARQSLQEAVMKQRLIQLDLNAGLGAEGRLQVKRVGDSRFRNPQRGEIWEFSPTGICEPVEVRVTNEAGVIELAFDPLTGCAVRKSIIVKS
ncbi:prepilin-type N-terminal cleavage/methylation domain-containing protein [Prosthecobacter debontii]|uniref:Prepilin-type N-terminal cleavage/methylation domain-containing protein n=1 Tax=Prosthecobacter debontii TaxID=48467 RepID=A0A1T4YGI7_9BACT|nr:prepilin-type N-terminal cleavage/methylation domain-containing protein [Prosthecobacter debontii]SKB00698.1 prepilin-type N-terminal cleavage/methylation domain-containing protein [Prosthecobacter debontii]